MRAESRGRADRSTAVGRVAAHLRGEILTGALDPGTPLREEQLAARFGASRHTVRAALARLAAERLAVAAPYRGVRVTSFDGDDILALQHLRMALECEAVRLAGERHGSVWPAEALAPAEAALDTLAALAGQAGLDADASGESDPDWLDVETAHADFHRALVEASGSPRIIEAHAALGSELRLFLLHVRPHYTVDALLAEHRDLLEAVQRRGAEALREHLARSAALLVDGRASPSA
ncbi:GntR family transcriptional regulator [Agromyces intestinalis]|uniref:GntR family transcriptional regulator n=1 Tax=Agromyces intestinalis TaxID=2592652 RepID=A0A5C1YE51_9MICO|nr:GntR family transcriptional regulator [Agromyces intestinalis]QEO14334.1 GntR family transcriptional regulator [Agromyces intestinalis]